MLLIAFLAQCDHDTVQFFTLLCWLPFPSNLLPIVHCTINYKATNISGLKEGLFRVATLAYH